MTRIALTGHTRGLGGLIYSYFVDNGHEIKGFSLSTGCDLRDYTQVGRMIDSILSYDWFINCAHPDYCQTQILYRLLDADFQGRVISVGSCVVHEDPGWTDLGLLQYVTQKKALYHACQSLDKLFPQRIFWWAPLHAGDGSYVAKTLKEYGL